MPMFLIGVFGTSFIFALAAVAGGYFLHQLFPFSLFEGTIIYIAMLLIGTIGAGLMSIVDSMSPGLDDFEE